MTGLIFLYTIGALVFLLAMLGQTAGNRRSLDLSMPVTAPVEVIFLILGLFWPVLVSFFISRYMTRLIWRFFRFFIGLVTMLVEKKKEERARDKVKARIKRGIQWTRYVKDGEAPPRGYGLVYYDLLNCWAVAYPVPFHLVYRFLRWAHFQLVMLRPGAIDLLLEVHYEKGKADGLREISRMVENYTRQAVVNELKKQRRQA